MSRQISESKKPAEVIPKAFRFFVRITACPSQKRALEDDGDGEAPVVEEHVAKRRDVKPDAKIRVLVVEGKFRFV